MPEYSMRSIAPSAPIVIVAPHSDDELIGCFSLLQARQVLAVLYYHDLTPTRMAEAEACAAEFGFTPHFCMDVAEAARCFKDSVFLLPAITDAHIQHQELNRQFRRAVRSSNLWYYSTDFDRLRSKSPLSPEVRELKKAALDKLYPSQRQLWETNASYYLFENVVPQDYTRYRTITLKAMGTLW